MSQGVVVLLGALVGGVASLAGVVISGAINARADVRKEQSARSSIVGERIRTQLTEVLRLMFLVETEIYSVCWLAARIPQHLDGRRVALYETRMHETLPQLSASMVILAGLDPALYDAVMPWMEQLDTLEGKATLSLYQLHEDATHWHRLGELTSTLVSFYHDLPAQLGPVLRRIDVP